MARFLIWLAVAALALPFAAHAQQAQRLPPGVACGTAQPPAGTSPVYMDSSGNLCTTTGAPGSSASNSGTPNQPAAVSCTNVTGTLLAAGAASSFFQFQNPIGGQTVYINFAGGSATVNASSFQLVGGASVYYPTAGFLPTALISCIVAAGSQNVTVIYK